VHRVGKQDYIVPRWRVNNTLKHKEQRNLREGRSIWLVRGSRGVNKRWMLTSFVKSHVKKNL